MKRILFYTFLLCIGFATIASAQTEKNRKTTNHQAIKEKSNLTQTLQDTGSFTSSGSNEAFGSRSGRFSISDPIINALNHRANGYNIPSGASGIPRMPKGTYGFANGKLLLRSTTATSPGTSYGSGGVGTGTAIMGTGTGENIPGVNGKNPYAGPWLWGTRPIPKQMPSIDSTRKQ